MTNFHKVILQRLLTLAVAGLGLAVTPGTASASFLDFTVDQSGVSNCLIATLPPGSCTFVADKINGPYVERFSITAPGVFSTVAYWDVEGFSSTDGTVPVDEGFLNTFEDPVINDGYRLYALFSSDGTFVPAGGGGFDFTAGTGLVSLFADLAQDGNPKVLPVSAPGAIGVPGGADVLLASATLKTGTGSINTTLDNGDFALVFNPFVLTGPGSGYFVAPSPFYMTALFEGNFNTFNPALANQEITGVANVTFIPEPATLALFGLGLLGSAYAARRRRKA